MKKNHTKITRHLGTLAFSVGIVLAFILLSLMVWGDLEASLFSSSLDAAKSLGSLRCPVFMSPNETGLITARFNNPTDLDWERYSRVFISEGFVSLMREIKRPIPVPAGGTQTVEWEVYPEDAAYDRIIFFRIYVNAKYPYPSLGGSCGIIMMDAGNLTGRQLFISFLVFSIALTALGLIIWKSKLDRSDPHFLNKVRSRYALTIILSLGIVIAYFGSWVIALLFLTVALLMIGIIIGRQTSVSI